MATKKKKVLQGITTTDAEQAFADYAKAESKSEEITGKMEQEITKVREKYQDQLATLKETKDTNFDILMAYAGENAELFKTKKSVDMSHGTIGYRTGQHKLEKLKGFKWDDVIEKLEKYLPDYVRTKKEVNKEGLINERNNEEVSKQFSKCGIEVNQDETFYVTPKKEAVPA